MKVNIKICCINGCTVSLHLVAFSNFKVLYTDMHRRGWIETFLHRSFKLCPQLQELSSGNWNFKVNIQTQ